MALTSLVAPLLALSAVSCTADVSAENDGAAFKQPPPGRRRMPYLKNSDLKDIMGKSYDPKTADNWVSMSEDVEFLPVLKNGMNGDVDGQNDPRRLTRSLEQTTGSYTSNNPYSVQPFVEGMSEYDEYQQAWRLLGFMIDCSIPFEDDDYQQGSHKSGDNEEVTESGCARYVIWAAYVDLNYEGGGIGEYQYYNRTSGEWDDNACYYADGGGGGDDDKGYQSRCAKMDCHSEDTDFSVLGFFKHRNYDDWMEQLFKHEGMCVWTEEEYSFMKNARKAWPSGCTDTGTTANVNGGTVSLYYNIRPLQYGRIAFGLYTDEECITYYSASTDTIENIIGNKFTQEHSQHSGDNGGDYDFSGDTLSESMERWDSAFDVWRTCHPCVAHDLQNTAGDMYTDDNYGGSSYYNWYNYGRRKLGGEYSAQGDIFECYDDAGYTNVNQCMKFSAKTVMKTATIRDLSLANSQGSLVEFPLSGYINAQKEYVSHKKDTFYMYFYLAAASCLFVFSLFKLYKAVREPVQEPTELTEELL